MKTHIDPPLPPFTFVFKYFLADCDINEPLSGGVGSFMLQLMIVIFNIVSGADEYELPGVPPFFGVPPGNYSVVESNWRC
jgi:hypothetical protein